MLNLPVIQNYTNLKLGPAVKLLNLVEKLKLYYFKTFVKSSALSYNPTDDNNSEDMGFSETNETNNMEVDVNDSNSDNQEDADENFSRLE